MHNIGKYAQLFVYHYLKIGLNIFCSLYRTKRIKPTPHKIVWSFKEYIPRFYIS